MSPLVMVDDAGEVREAVAALLVAAGLSVENGTHLPQPRAESGSVSVFQVGSGESEVVRAIRRATLGMRRAAALDGDVDDRVARALSPREREVLELAARGLTADGIAGELFLSVETVRTHTRNAIRKLHARNRLHAVVLALSAGVIAPPVDS